MSTQWDAIVIGSGPGGCAFSTMFARWGRRVLVLEKEVFPRYHIGESLLPANWRILDAMGVGDTVRNANFVHKGGGTFIWGLDREPWTVYFGEIDGLPVARQVKRDEFDKILQDNAIACGADIRQGCEVKKVIFEGDRAVGVRYRDQQGVEHEARAPWIVDASGQNKFLGRRLGLVEYHPDFHNVAIWSYWENGKRLPGRDAGNVLYITHDYGWFWYIPLDDEKNLISVGTIIRPHGRHLIKERGPEQFYHDMIAATDALPGMLAEAKQVAPVRTIADYSYACSKMTGPGWILVGDAACFVDPILSSGVQLACYHGLLAALTLNTIMDNPDLEAEACAYYEQLYRKQYNNFASLCLSMYDTQKKSKEGYFASARQLIQPTVAKERPVNAPANGNGNGNGSHHAGPPQGDGQAFGDRLAFISMISGLAPHETQRVMMQFLGDRKKAMAGTNEEFSFSEEVLSMLFNHVHRAELEEGRKQRIGEELDDDSVLRPAPEVTLQETLFLPSEQRSNRLKRQKAVTNRFGDRFQPTRELETLLNLMNGERTLAEIQDKFFETFQVDPLVHEKPFRAWVDMLATHGIVEWQKF